MPQSAPTMTTPTDDPTAMLEPGEASFVTDLLEGREAWLVRLGMAPTRAFEEAHAYAQTWATALLEGTLILED